MTNRMAQNQDERGTSARHLVLLFLVGVAVCAVFFSLGFVVGYNRSPLKTSPVTEGIGNTGNIPPTVNPPPTTSNLASTHAVQTKEIDSGSAPGIGPEHLQSQAGEESSSEAAEAEHPAKRLRSPETPKVSTAAPVKKPSYPPTAKSSKWRFAVQVMASKTRADAMTLVRLLKARGYRTFLIAPQHSRSKGNLYKVHVGPYASRPQAERILHKLEREGFRPFIVH